MSSEQAALLVPFKHRSVLKANQQRDLHPVTGHSKLCFYGERSHDRPISENFFRAVLLTLGYSPEVQTVHGFRAKPIYHRQSQYFLFR